MCTLAIYFQVSAEYPIVVAANRDEFYSRPTRPPAQIRDQPWVVAGHDVIAGGTWLGVNALGMVAGLLNRRTAQAPDPTRRSRGLLCLDALACRSVEAAVSAVECTNGTLYNPFNLLLASTEKACIMNNATGRMQSTVLEPGVHLVTNLDVNDSECPRIAKSHRLFETARAHLHPDSLPRFRDELRAILSDHSTPLDPRASEPPTNLCVHGERFGTRSSTLLLYSAATGRFRMWHTDTAPCLTQWTELALPAG